ncbi:MBL fold metallo-hydrolase [Pyrococcus sp. ST04]|uniref:MBL fold metallo-hydrolase n=1 Tax=Pyrococcus sp. ST04 TaxID=1183377 RepID=UPI000260595D|nr:MBL fold metallo-hydrolase [Pyrococcus sp. ST04]AFK21774.1 putative glyoxalase II [Pyrococcus sp. ST04]
MIHRIFDEFVNVYLIERPEFLICVDAGIESTCDKIVEKVKEIGKPLKLIILTHYHFDHTGSLRCLKEKFPEAKVVAHEEDSPSIEANTGVKVDVKVKGGEVIEGVRIFHMPGHTRGSICILDEDSKSLFVGDLLMEKGGKLEEIPRQYSLDPEMNRQRIKELLNIDFENLYPAHGNPVIGKAKERVKELVKRLGG